MTKMKKTGVRWRDRGMESRMECDGSGGPRQELGKQTAHLILRFVVSCFCGILVPSISPHRLRCGGHGGGCRVSGLLHGRRAGLLHLLRLPGPLVFFHSIHYCNYLGFLLSLEK
jgi:hypothetical protein